MNEFIVAMVVLVLLIMGALVKLLEVRENKKDAERIIKWRKP